MLTDRLESKLYHRCIISGLYVCVVLSYLRLSVCLGLCVCGDGTVQRPIQFDAAVTLSRTLNVLKAATSSEGGCVATENVCYFSGVCRKNKNVRLHDCYLVIVTYYANQYLRRTLNYLSPECFELFVYDITLYIIISDESGDVLSHHPLQLKCVGFNGNIRTKTRKVAGFVMSCQFKLPIGFGTLPDRANREPQVLAPG